VDVPAVNRADLEATLAKAFINLGCEGSIDFQENPVLHCMSIFSPAVVVVFLAVTAFHRFK